MGCDRHVLRQRFAQRAPWILCVDDELEILESLRDTLYPYFDFKSATSGPEGLAQLSETPERFAIVMSDMRMPVMSGAVFLREARLPRSAEALGSGASFLGLRERSTSRRAGRSRSRRCS